MVHNHITKPVRQNTRKLVLGAEKNLSLGKRPETSVGLAKGSLY